MSFFAEAKRNTGFPVTLNPSPHDYQISKNAPCPKSYAPFGSTTKLSRATNNKNNRDKQQEQRVVMEDDRVFFIDDRQLNEMTPEKPNFMFKSKSQRFVPAAQIVGPGPTSYAPASQSRSQHLYRKNLARSRNTSAFELSRKINPPSIPTDSLGFKCEKDKIEKIPTQPPRELAPGSYNVGQSLFKDKGIAWSTAQTLSRKDDGEALPGPGHYNLKVEKANAPSSCFKSQINRFNPKKIKPARQPGPGDYDLSKSQPLKQLSQTHFNSKAMRFPVSKSSHPGPGAYLEQKSKSFKQLRKISQRDQPKRETIFNQTNKVPGPGQYIAREGMTFELQKALLRKHNASQFATERRQVFEPKWDEIDQPGPGSYNPEKPAPRTGKLGYDKVEVVNLKDDQGEETSPFYYNCDNHTIAKKIESESRRLTLTEAKPFSCGVDRFPHYSKGQQPKLPAQPPNPEYTSGELEQQTGTMNFSNLKKTKKLVMTSVKVKAPFGTSGSKFSDTEASELGPGQYNLQKNWVKPSHSIRGKLNGRGAQLGKQER